MSTLAGSLAIRRRSDCSIFESVVRRTVAGSGENMRATSSLLRSKSAAQGGRLRKQARRFPACKKRIRELPNTLERQRELKAEQGGRTFARLRP